MKKYIILVFFNFLFFFVHGQIQIIPEPSNTDLKGDNFKIDKETIIICSPELANLVGIFAERIRVSTGFPLEIKYVNPNSREQNVIKVIENTDMASDKEDYFLEVTSEEVRIESGSVAGIHNGLQSLRQLFPSDIERGELLERASWLIPGVRIEDSPRFAWRGYMKDVSRTFYSVEVLKKYIDVLSFYKLNIFHLHLTDDQGWRVEIKKYPRLTSEKATVFPVRFNQPTERSGYYTQEEIKDLVEYAADRNVTIVPEIDIPGHIWPALIAYPELGVNDKLDPDYVFPFLDSWTIWGNQFTPNTLDPTKENVYDFLDDLFTEIAMLFPSKYIHFGGDEVRHEIWDKEPHIVQFMKDKGMSSSLNLQSYFVDRVVKIIKDKGRIPIGWNDILKDSENLPQETIIMSWLGSKAVKEAANKGFQTVATPTGYLYLDIAQHSRHDGTMSDLAYSNINSLERIYHYDPTAGLENREVPFVLGVQANQWTAIPQEIKDMNVQNFPRLLALSEISWSSPRVKDLENFMSKLNSHYVRLDYMGIDYFLEGGYVVGQWNPDKINSVSSFLEFDVTDKVYASGRAMAGLFYVSGDDFLEIKGVQLFEDKAIISSDNHQGLADSYRGTSKKKSFLYNLEVKTYNPRAKYLLRIEVKGVDGKDSYGNVTFNLNPKNPFGKDTINEKIRKSN